MARHLAVTAAVAAVLAGVAFFILGRINRALVTADMIFAQAQQFDGRGDWYSHIDVYRRALRVRTQEDHYSLLLGCALLEQAKQTEPEGLFQLGTQPTWIEVLQLTPQELQQMGRFDLLRSAEVILQRGQTINPLNSDHTTNLARLYRTWAELSSNQVVRQEMLEKSIAHYNVAVQLSPNMTHLWNEKDSTHLAHGKLEEAEAAYQHSLALDKFFEETYLLLAEYYDSHGQYMRAVEVLEQGIAVMEADPRVQPAALMYRYLSAARQQSDED